MAYYNSLCKSKTFNVQSCVKIVVVRLLVYEIITGVDWITTPWGIPCLTDPSYLRASLAGSFGQEITPQHSIIVEYCAHL